MLYAELRWWTSRFVAASAASCAGIRRERLRVDTGGDPVRSYQNRRAELADRKYITFFDT